MCVQINFDILLFCQIPLAPVFLFSLVNTAHLAGRFVLLYVGAHQKWALFLEKLGQCSPGEKKPQQIHNKTKQNTNSPPAIFSPLSTSNKCL